MGSVKWVVGGVVAAVVVLAVLVGSGQVSVPGLSGKDVPCSELVSDKQARDAVAAQSGLVKTLGAAGAKVTVERQSGCSGDTNYAVVIAAPSSVTSAVDKIMNAEGFGVFASRKNG